MKKEQRVRIKSQKIKGMYLDGVDGVLGLAIPYYEGKNPPTFKKADAERFIEWLNSYEGDYGYVKHDWKIEKV